jgi:hypothetical protein
MFLQHLSLKLGVASGRDLAQACRDAYPRCAALRECLGVREAGGARARVRACVRVRA